MTARLLAEAVPARRSRGPIPPATALRLGVRLGVPAGIGVIPRLETDPHLYPSVGVSAQLNSMRDFGRACPKDPGSLVKGKCFAYQQ
jgi:hypothetical protein